MAEAKKELRGKLAELQKQLAQRPAEPKIPAQEKVDPRAIERAVAAATKPLLTQLGAFQKAALQMIENLTKAEAPLVKIINSALPEVPQVAPPPVDARKLETPPVRTIPRPTASVPVNGSSGSGEVGNVGQNILNQLAELEALGITKPEKAQLALMAGYTNARSGGFTEPLAGLVQDGLVVYPNPGFVMLTDAGRQKAITQERPLTMKELHDRLCQKLDGAEAKILRELIAAHPDSMSKEELASRLNYGNPRSGGFTEPLGRLRALGIAEYPQPKFAKAADWLFIEGAA